MNRLTTKYIKRCKDKPVALKCPPKMYDFIEQEDWEIFVCYRTFSAFEEIGQIYRERRAKNIYNHGLLKKGYVGLEDELDEITKKSEKEVIATGCRNDVLKITLGIFESSGRVRTRGRFAPPSSYFGRKKRSFPSNNELQECIVQLEENYEKFS
ncbi:hypothetical protein AB3S75_044826 [Citrus x aurantiifolia]